MPTLRLLPELEDELRHVTGVRAVSIVTDSDRVPTEVHVLASPGKPAKQLVRDVQTLAMARYDIDIDHRIVSVVQIDEEQYEALPAPAGGTPRAGRRVRLISVTVRTTAGTAHASVTVALGERLVTGSCSGPIGRTHRPRLLASAALEAAQGFLDRPCAVESAVVVPVGTREVALCVLTVGEPDAGDNGTESDARDGPYHDRGELVITGSAPVTSDLAEAVSRSVLAAVNRQLSR